MSKGFLPRCSSDSAHIMRYIKKLWLEERKAIICSLIFQILYSIGFVGFTLPYKLADQGIIGVAAFMQYAFHINSAHSSFLMNNAALLIASRSLDKRFFVWSIINVFLLSFAIEFWQTIPFPMVSDIMLVSIVGGVLKGVGIAALYLGGVSAGGCDAIFTVLKKKFGLEAGVMSSVVNCTVALISFQIIGMQRLLYGLVAAYISGVALDRTLALFDKRHMVFLISSSPHDVVTYIEKTLGRGSTLLESTGGHTGEQSKTIMTLMDMQQVTKLKQYVAKNYPASFMTVMEVSEVLGKGFKRWKYI